MKAVSIIVIFSLLAGSGLMAQKPGKANPEARKAIKSYVQENVLPTLQAQRAKLDNELSASEQAALTSIRSELKALREKGKEFRPQIREQRKQGEMPSASQRSAIREHAKTRRLLMDRAWKIADAHETTIYRLIDETASQQEQWRSELKELMEQYRPADAPVQGEEPGSDMPHPKMRPRGQGHRPGHGRGHGKLNKLRQLGQPVMFLLWDGKTLPGKDGIGREMGQGKGKANRAQVIPNPSSNSHELRYKVQSSGMVTITLLDYTGKPLRRVFEGQASAGQNTINLPIDQLEPGLYFYKITAQDEEKAVRFFVE